MTNPDILPPETAQQALDNLEFSATQVNEAMALLTRLQDGTVTWENPGTAEDPAEVLRTAFHNANFAMMQAARIIRGPGM